MQRFHPNWFVTPWWRYLGIETCRNIIDVNSVNKFFVHLLVNIIKFYEMHGTLYIKTNLHGNLFELVHALTFVLLLCVCVVIYYTLNPYFMDIFHSVYWNWAHYVCGTGSVSIFRLTFTKPECYYIMTFCIQISKNETQICEHNIIK